MTGSQFDSERRNFRRVPLVCDVWQRGYPSAPGDSGVAGMAGRTLNLSDGGVLIQLTRLPEGAFSRPRLGQLIELTLALPRVTTDTYLLEHVRVEGEVVRVVGPGADQPPASVAVRFGRPVNLQLD